MHSNSKLLIPRKAHLLRKKLSGERMPHTIWISESSSALFLGGCLLAQAFLRMASVNRGRSFTQHSQQQQHIRPHTLSAGPLRMASVNRGRSFSASGRINCTELLLLAQYLR
eukprot:1158358-Pelagomonas_calceolata.AAC.6